VNAVSHLVSDELMCWLLCCFSVPALWMW